MHHDRLTGLANRALFHQRLETTLAEAKARKTKVGVLLVDLDHLKDINTRLGTSTGDEALRVVGEALSRSAGGAQWVARVGEDEFAVILPDVSGTSQAEVIGNGICTKMGSSSAENPVSYSVTVGVAVFPDHGNVASDLLEDAEIALTRAKASRNNRVVPFLREMRRSRERRLETLEQVRQGLAEDRVFPFYQPKVSLTTGRTVGFEALLRWRHRTRGVQLPGIIIEAFDDRELSEQLSARMQERVLADIVHWSQLGVPFGRIALNASPTELREEGYAAGLLARLERARIAPEKIEVEVTENAFVGEDSARVAAELRRLSEAGVKIALDDFGTGYGSLIHLRQFPVDVVKIDRSFIMDIGPSPNAALIAHAIINLSHALEIEVVAEGVESTAQAQFLKDSGCDVAQGFLFSKALPAVSVPDASRSDWSELMTFR
jgi:diguanylate cyclase (GGDEF)-like protein